MPTSQKRRVSEKMGSLVGDAPVFVDEQYEESRDNLIGVTHFRNMVAISVFARRHLPRNRAQVEPSQRICSVREVLHLS